MQKQKDKNKDINYYEILYKLQDYNYRLSLELIKREKERKENKKPIICTTPIELLINETRGYIFSVDILKKFYTDKITAFNKPMEESAYKNKAYEAYTKLKEYVKSITPENYKIVYSMNMDKHRKGLTGSHNFRIPFNAYIRKKGERENKAGFKNIVNDNPLLYFYPSVLLPHLIKQDYAGITCLFGIKMFYEQFISFHYLEFPKDIEFYLSSAIWGKLCLVTPDAATETTGGDVHFSLYLILSCLWYVLAELQSFIQDELQKDLKAPILVNNREKHRLTYNPDDGTFYLNNKPLELTETLLKAMTGIYEYNKPSDIKDYMGYQVNVNKNTVYELRQIIKKSIPENIISTYREQKRTFYFIDTTVTEKA